MIKAFMIDLDGVVYKGETPREGAVEFFDYLISHGISHCVITNHSSFHRKYYSEKLNRMGVDVPVERILSSPYEVALRAQELGYKRAYVIGREGLIEELKEVGCLTSEDPDFVVVGYDENYNFQKITKAIRIVLDGKPLWIANPDRLLPKEDGFYPDSGSLGASIVYATATQPVYFGKPNEHIFKKAFDLLGVKPEESVMIGDTLETDILGAKRVGAKSVYISGVEKRGFNGVSPDYSFKNLREVLKNIENIMEADQR